LEGYSAFGIQARTIMLKKNITVKALAQQIGIGNSYLSEILKGRRDGEKYKPEIMRILGMSEQ
jgi:transcriptional regulator with XRE-family HTH domain